MWTLMALAALVALSTVVLAWQARRGTKVIAGMGGLAGALAVAAWLATPGESKDTVAAPEAWIVDSAKAFSRPGMPATPGGMTSLPEMADRLAARLAKSPDDAAGWSLLATTYRQLGREEDAVAAEQRAIKAGGDPGAASDAHRLQMSSAGTSSMPATVTGGRAAAARHVAEGQRLRIQRKFPEAEQAFRKAVEADPADADSWADLADCSAVVAGHDLEAGRDAIEKALSINPQHRKALWLRASLELQKRQYRQAATTWRTLQTLVPPGSPDARVIAANITEADSLAAASGRAG